MLIDLALRVIAILLVCYLVCNFTIYLMVSYQMRANLHNVKRILEQEQEDETREDVS